MFQRSFIFCTWRKTSKVSSHQWIIFNNDEVTSRINGGYLANRFNIVHQEVSEIFATWIDRMLERHSDQYKLTELSYAGIRETSLSMKDCLDVTRSTKAKRD